MILVKLLHSLPPHCTSVHLRNQESDRLLVHAEPGRLIIRDINQLAFRSRLCLADSSSWPSCSNSSSLISLRIIGNIFPSSSSSAWCSTSSFKTLNFGLNLSLLAVSFASSRRTDFICLCSSSDSSTISFSSSCSSIAG